MGLVDGVRKLSENGTVTGGSNPLNSPRRKHMSMFCVHNVRWTSAVCYTYVPMRSDDAIFSFGRCSKPYTMQIMT